MRYNVSTSYSYGKVGLLKQYMTKKNVNEETNPQSKIRGRVFSPDTSGSKMAQLLVGKGFEPRILSRGETVEGTVVSILPESVLIDIGVKAEGIIPRRELEEVGEKPEVGKKVKTIVAQSEGDSGTVILTVKKAIKEKAWENLQQLYDKGETVDVKGVTNNRGGLIVDYKGTRGFVPSSHLVTEPKQAVGKPITVKVLQINARQNKLVFSEKDTTAEIFPKMELPFKVGDVLDVVVAKILPFGLLVSTPSGPDGLVHISEISWKKVTGLAENFKLGQKLQAKLISIDAGSGRINLSIKQLEKDPWKEAEKKYKVGEIFERPVSRTSSYGVFVELEEGIEGLIHSSKIPYRVEFKGGDKVKIQVDLFNSDQKRVALRLAQEEKEPDNTKSKPAKAKAVNKDKRTKDVKKGH
ncbi:MAG: S1 RNA-binding domain-containing protein [Candidatus Woykebacteria bacterium]